MLNESLERQVYGTILGKAEEMSIVVHAIGGVPDHVHAVVSIPPKIAIAECIKHFKGASSYYVNHQPGGARDFEWQDGYGVLTVGQRGLPDVIGYVLNQKDHHRQNTLRPPFERITSDDDGEQAAIE